MCTVVTVQMITAAAVQYIGGQTTGAYGQCNRKKNAEAVVFTQKIRDM